MRSVIMALLLCGACATLPPRRPPDIPLDRPEIRLACAVRAPAQVQVGVPVPLTFALRNISKEPVRFLIWLTPFEGWRGDIMRVTRDGEKVEYRGIMASRLWPPPTSSYFTVVRDVELSVTLDVSGVYPMNEPGRYVIHFYGRLLDSYGGSEKGDHKWSTGGILSCTPATVDVTLSQPKHQ